MSEEKSNIDILLFIKKLQTKGDIDDIKYDLRILEKWIKEKMPG